ncbi:MAG: rhodanese-like domain-containing protein [bacterium]|nr:rhodanese-like domain-containing protein [bacterium]
MHKTISTDELKKKLDAGGADFVLVDVLSKEKYAARHVPGAVSIPETPDFAKTFEAALQVPKDTQIAVYCTSDTCQASVRAADALEKAGYTNVLHYKDGIAGWQQAGFPFESSN